MARAVFPRGSRSNCRRRGPLRWRVTSLRLDLDSLQTSVGVEPPHGAMVPHRAVIRVPPWFPAGHLGNAAAGAAVVCGVDSVPKPIYLFVCDRLLQLACDLVSLYPILDHLFLCFVRETSITSTETQGTPNPRTIRSSLGCSSTALTSSSSTRARKCAALPGSGRS